MKRITFICLVLMAGCSEDQEYDKLSQWTVSWKIGDEEISGNLVLYNDHRATLRVNGEDQSLLLKEPAAVSFFWQIRDKELTLKRLDNDIELKYEIIRQSPNKMTLAFAEDITVILSRQ